MFVLIKSINKFYQSIFDENGEVFSLLNIENTWLKIQSLNKPLAKVPNTPPPTPPRLRVGGGVISYF
ncbi:hypothetical protein CK516_14930 [Nostoc sp. 'Peltigera malacea cyanobiont' DB3992]|nr:hypothetical protein CK516_14930 [Nostoc sp. 'Peltigera malacea cyanobiont' DB3992]